MGAIRVQSVTRFPGRIVGADGIAVVRSGGAATVRPATGDLVEVADIADPAATYMVVHDAVNDVYSRISVAGLGVLTAGWSIARQVFTASDTYTPSTGMVYCLIRCRGGSGAGGGATGASSSAIAGGGGGEGGLSELLATATDIGTSQTVTVGAGGTGVSGASGGDGGDTSVGTLCVAKGGKGGVAGQAGNSGQGGAGGSLTGAAGDLKLAGQSGGYGIRAALTMTAVHGGAGGGGAPGAVAGNTQANEGNAASSGGGGGAAVNNSTSSAAGGNGAGGWVDIIEFCRAAEVEE